MRTANTPSKPAYFKRVRRVLDAIHYAGFAGGHHHGADHERGNKAGGSIERGSGRCVGSGSGSLSSVVGETEKREGGSMGERGAG